MLIALRGVQVGYDRPILPPISMDIRRGERIGILGPNGAGKSTLLRTIIGLLAPLAGRIEYPHQRRPRIGYVPQSHRPDPAFPLTTSEVVMMGRYPRLGIGRRPHRADRDAVRAQLEAVGLAAQEQRAFRDLSGGQRQRAMLARALVGEPELLVLDEPTSEMDPAAEHELLQLVDQLAGKSQACVLFVTHELSAAAGFANTLVLINHRTGVIETGPIAQLLSSEALSRLYGRKVELHRDGDRALLWISSDREAGR